MHDSTAATSRRVEAPWARRTRAPCILGTPLPSHRLHWWRRRAGARRVRLEVQPAFGLVRAGPAPRPSILELRHGSRRGAAADGEIPLAEQRMDGELAVGLVVRDVVVGPGGDGIDLDHRFGFVPVDDGRGGSLVAVDALEARHPRTLPCQGALQRCGLAELTTPFRTTRPCV